MHFDFTITLGNVITIVTIALGFWRFNAIAVRFLVEHEFLIEDYCHRKGMKVSELATRAR